MISLVDDAVPAKHFAFPPYKAEKVGLSWSAVMNCRGLNVLTFKNKPGAVFTDYKTALAIADKWNQEQAK